MLPQEWLHPGSSYLPFSQDTVRLGFKRGSSEALWSFLPDGGPRKPPTGSAWPRVLARGSLVAFVLSPLSLLSALGPVSKSLVGK